MKARGDVETAILSFLFRDTATLARARGHMRPSLFRRANREAAEFLCRWFDEHGEAPPEDVVRLHLGEDAVRRYHVGRPLPGGTELVRLREAVWEEFREWLRSAAFAVAVQRAAQAIGTPHIDAHIREIASVAEMQPDDDPGLDPLEDPRAVAERLRDMRGTIATGWPEVDRRLQGGFGRGELAIFAGLSGAGKSVVLQQLAVQWRRAGYIVAYLTLELSVELCGVRMAAMSLGVAVHDILRDPSLLHPDPAPGRLFVRYMPGGSPIGRISGWLRSLRLVHGVEPDVVIVDYLDEVEPEGLPVDRNVPLWERDRWRTRQLRDLAVREQVAMVTATQLNRTAVGQPELDMDHVGGGLGKVQIADNVIAIRSDARLREEGVIEMHFVKTRSSGGVGSRVRLSWDPRTLRIGERPVPQESGEAADSADAPHLRSASEEIAKKIGRRDEEPF